MNMGTERNKKRNDRESNFAKYDFLISSNVYVCRKVSPRNHQKFVSYNITLISKVLSGEVCYQKVFHEILKVEILFICEDLVQPLIYLLHMHHIIFFLFLLLLHFAKNIYLSWCHIFIPIQY